MRRAVDDELDGAVAALLGLHSNNRPAPAFQPEARFKAMSASSTPAAHHSSTWVGASSPNSLYPIATVGPGQQAAIFAPHPYFFYPCYHTHDFPGPNLETAPIRHGYPEFPATASRDTLARRNQDQVSGGFDPWKVDPRHLESRPTHLGSVGTFRRCEPFGGRMMCNQPAATIRRPHSAERQPPPPSYAFVESAATKQHFPQPQQKFAHDRHRNDDVHATQQQLEKSPPPLQQKQQQQQQRYQQEQKEEEENKQQQQQQQQQERPSIKQLWSLIPGNFKRVGDSHSDQALDSSGGSFSPTNAGTPETPGGHKETVYDVHQPLSHSQRLHRARAIVRLRARRRAMAAAESAAAAAAGRAPGAAAKKRRSDTIIEVESSDGENDRRDGVEGKETETSDSNTCGGKYSRVKSGGNEDCNATVMSEERAMNADAPDAGTKLETKSLSSCTTASDSSNLSSSSGTPSKVGDLFELMRSVSANAAAAALAAEGGVYRSDVGAGESREMIGRPVKYKYRQEAARSRKRTRGRFVSEKAPAFVSITELMATRRAERERQKKDETVPVPVGAS